VSRGPRRTALAVAVLAAAGAALAAGRALRAAPAALDRARPGSASTGAAGEQRVALELAGGVYTPNVVHVRAGAPVRLRVAARDRHGCAARLLVPDLGVDLALVPGGVAEVVLPAPRPGGHVFTCGDKMVKGTIVAE
jgi:Cu+-exporting ATPase